jgi:hypothetical protein
VQEPTASERTWKVLAPERLMKLLVESQMKLAVRLLSTPGPVLQARAPT